MLCNTSGDVISVTLSSIMGLLGEIIESLGLVEDVRQMIQAGALRFGDKYGA